MVIPRLAYHKVIAFKPYNHCMAFNISPLDHAQMNFAINSIQLEQNHDKVCEKGKDCKAPPHRLASVYKDKLKLFELKRDSMSNKSKIKEEIDLSLIEYKPNNIQITQPIQSNMVPTNNIQSPPLQIVNNNQNNVQPQDISPPLQIVSNNQNNIQPQDIQQTPQFGIYNNNTNNKANSSHFCNNNINPYSSSSANKQYGSYNNSGINSSHYIPFQINHNTNNNNDNHNSNNQPHDLQQILLANITNGDMNTQCNTPSISTNNIQKSQCQLNNNISISEFQQNIQTYLKSIPLNQSPTTDLNESSFSSSTNNSNKSPFNSIMNNFNELPLQTNNNPFTSSLRLPIPPPPIPPPPQSNNSNNYSSTTSSITNTQPSINTNNNKKKTMKRKYKEINGKKNNNNNHKNKRKKCDNNHTTNNGKTDSCFKPQLNVEYYYDKTPALQSIPSYRCKGQITQKYTNLTFEHIGIVFKKNHTNPKKEFTRRNIVRCNECKPPKTLTVDQRLRSHCYSEHRAKYTGKVYKCDIPGCNFEARDQHNLKSHKNKKSHPKPNEQI